MTFQTPSDATYLRFDLGRKTATSQIFYFDDVSLKKYETSTGHFRFDADKTEETGHADHFWAKALAAQAASRPAGKIEYRGVVRRRFAELSGAY